MKKLLQIFCVIIIAYFFPNTVSAQAPNWLWARSAGGNNDDLGQLLCSDNTGNVYMAGLFFGPTMFFGNDSLVNPNVGFEKSFLAKYDANGNFKWARNVYRRCYGITCDLNDNIYVTGIFDTDTAFIKYDTLGNIVSAEVAIGYGNGKSITTDADGNVYLTGDFYSPTITFDSITLTNAGGTDFYGNPCGDVFVVKFNNAGDALWARSAGGLYYDESNGITVDANGSVCITGNFASDYITFGSTVIDNLFGGLNYYRIFVVKLDSLGNYQWAKSTDYNGLASVSGNDIISSNTDIYVAGYSMYDTIIFGSDTLIPNLFLIKYDALGNIQWVETPDGSGYNQGFKLIEGPSGNIYLGGLYVNSMTIGLTTITSPPNAHTSFIAKFDNQGNIIWLKSTNANNKYVYKIGLTCDALENVFIVGNYKAASISFGSDTLFNTDTLGGVLDVFIARLGDPLITHTNEFSTMERTPRIYPNPTSTSFSIQLPPTFGTLDKLEIFNSVGQMVGRYKTVENIDISKYPAGLFYIVVWNQEGEWLTGKVVKE